MFSFFSTLFLGLIAALIGATLQQRTWRHRSQADFKEREYREARENIQSISSALDKRLAAQRTYTELVLAGEISDTQVASYKNATAEWMGEFSSNKSKLFHSFGGAATKKFETNIQIELQRASAIVGRGRKLSPSKLSTKDRNLYDNSEYRLSVIQHHVYEFMNELNIQVTNCEYGRTKAINNLNHQDYSFVSKTYLIRRLLGIERNEPRTYW
jgi:hypothetical protein